MAISRLQASLAAVSNELTVAAANINFDFTLIRCEAPKEFQALGQNLSQKRKDEAETGTIHTTARRLGALFEGICPPTPNLVKAYGTRVSEISEASTAKMGTTQAKNTMFAAHSGVDGDSIWAAATSSTTAIHVQLLACMLSRLWTGPEATSIWVELIKERKKRIASQFENGEYVHFSTITAATQLDMPRSQLAHWDASARAWLRTADSIKMKQQKRLQSIIDKVSISVNPGSEVLSSVLTAWISALESMEKLISGMPQAVNHGPTLLALGSWYLYPDILILGKDTADVRFNDLLVAPGGTLTVGLAKPGDDEHHGIYWSLSLAHLRYYGHPVETKQHLNYDSARINFSQLCQATFGCLLGYWEIPNNSLVIVAKLFVAIEDAFEKESQKSLSTPGAPQPQQEYFQDSSHWLHFMADAARVFTEDGNEEQATAKKLVYKGIRQSFHFVAGPVSSWPLFRLAEMRILLRKLRGTEARIKYLRYAAKSYFRTKDSLIIQYYTTVGKSRQETNSTLTAQYATAFPRHHKSSKRKHLEQDGSEISRHQRWFLRSESLEPLEPSDLDEDIIWRHPEHFLVQDDGRVDVQTAPGVWESYRHVFGDPSIAVILQSYVRELPSVLSSHGTHKNSTEQFEVSIEDIMWCLGHELFSLPLLLHHIERYHDPLAEISRTLKALSVISVVYKLLPEATIAITILNQPLHLTLWARAMYRKGPKDSIGLALGGPSEVFDERLLDRCIAFSCVAYLDSGYCDIAPEQLVGVIALSSGDSLYIAMPVSHHSTLYILD